MPRTHKRTHARTHTHKTNKQTNKQNLPTTPPQVDQIIATTFGMPMGPFRLNDLVGSDIGLHVGKNFVEAFSERVRFRGGPGFKPRRRRLFSVALPPPRARVGALCLGIVTPGFLARVGRTDAIKGLLPPPVSTHARTHPPTHPFQNISRCTSAT